MKELGKAIVDYKTEDDSVDHAAKGLSREQVEKLVSNVFQEFYIIYPTTRSIYPTQELLDKARQMWADEFIENKLTDKLVAAGLRMCKKSIREFPPPIGMFIDYCYDPKSHGIPDIDVAKKEGLKNAGLVGQKMYWSHPVCERVYQLVGSWSFLHSMERELKDKIDVAYKRATEEYLGGEICLRQQLPNPSQNGKKVITESDEKVGRKVLDNLLVNFKNHEP